MLNYSIIRRYTPPTCTLNLLARSLLSPWRKHSVEALRFELRFDDPRSPDANQVILQGDRAQLELLSDVVNRYVQTFLQSSSLSLASRSATATFNHSVPAEASNQLAMSSAPYFQQQGLLHKLFFGSLAKLEDAIELSTIQLFDLANALEAAQTGIASLPQEQAQSRRQTLRWAGGTLALLLAVSIPVGIKIWQSETESEDVALQDIETEPVPSEPAVVPPVPPPPDSTLIPAPSLPPALDNQRLLPPPPVKAPSPSARLPAPPNKPVPPAAPPKTAITVKPNLPNSSSPPPTASEVKPRANANVAPQLPNLPVLEPRPTAQAPPPTSSTKPPGDAAAGDVAPKALLDNIPQVAEVRQYFQKQWQPPENLSQTLEYRLVLNSDGSIKRIIPLGRASEVYLDRTGMPLMGETFVSALSEAANPQVRVVLNPDGSVQTFLESS